MSNHKESGIIFSIIITIILTSQFAINRDTWFLILQSQIIVICSFFLFAFAHTIKSKKKEFRLLEISLIILLCNSIILLLSNLNYHIISSIITSSMGLLLVFLNKKTKKIAKKQIKSAKNRHSRKRKDDIDRQLDDPWKEEPHILYDAFELEKFDI